MNVLAVGAHWDDIELGCGLSLMRLKEQGAIIYGVILTGSEYEMIEINHKREKAKAFDEGTKAFKKLGFIHTPTTPLPTAHVGYNLIVMQELETIVREKNIDMVFTHWFGDHNTDHVGAWDISRVAFRRVPNVLQYQSNAYFDNINVFSPQYFWGFKANEYEKKKEILKIHDVEWQLRKERWEREIFDRERFWGHLSGYDYAEGFMITRLNDGHRLVNENKQIL